MESRRAPRVPFQTAVRFVISPRMRTQDGLFMHQIEGQTLDISTLGIGFESAVFLPKGTRICGKMVPKNLGKDRTRAWPFVGTVRSCQVLRGKRLYRLGINFERLSKRTTEKIAAYVQNNLA